jgi:hypothetical protein
MSRQVQKSVNLGDRGPLRTIGNLSDFVSCANFPFLQHSKIESRFAMFYEQGCHPGLIHAHADAVARYARLRHFEYCITNAVTIANANLVIGKSLNREVFSELAESEVFPSQKAFPVEVNVVLIDKDGALFTPVSGEIALGVADNIELAHDLSSLNRAFPDRGTHGLTVPCHLAWKTDIHRQKSSQVSTPVGRRIT